MDKIDYIKFSQTNIESLIMSNKLDLNELVLQFEREDLIGTARYKDSSGLPWGSWNEVSKMIDLYLNKAGWIFHKSKNINYNCNVAYFAPNIFINTDNFELLDIINEFSHQQLSFIFTKKTIVSHIINIINNNFNMLSNCNLLFCIKLLFSLSAYGLLSKEEEVKLCNSVLNTHTIKNESDRIIIALIKKRIISLTNKNKSKILNPNNPRVALLISGQLRGFERSIPKLKNKFGHLDNIDAYVSTWKNIGISEFKPLNFYRILDKEAYDYCINNPLILDNIKQIDTLVKKIIYKSYPIKILKEKLTEMLSWCKNININIDDEEILPFSQMSNAEKMYYHNFYFLTQLNEYDYIIKVRPDLEFLDLTPINFDNINKGFILTESSNYICSEWGFGLGDQIWIGYKEDILPLFTCYDKSSLSYLYMYNFGKEPYIGHQNVGIQAWLEGIYPTVDNEYMKKYRLAFANQLTKQQIINIISELRR